MTPTEIGLIGIIVLIIFLFSQMPVGFVMAMVGLAGISYMISFQTALHVLVKNFFAMFGSYDMSVVPLFILMGQVSFHAGISRRLFDTANKILDSLPGGLAIATIGACSMFAAICGSTNASVATMATVALPEMKRYRYSSTLGAGSVVAGGSLGILIPPSILFIIYGIATEQSIGKLFAAGILPGILLSLLFCIAIVLWTYFKPDLAPRAERTTLREKLLSLSGVTETLLLFFLVMGGLFFGYFTPTEAGAVGAGGAVLLGVVRRKLSWKGLALALVESTRISCMILVIVAGAITFGHFLAFTRLPFAAANWVVTLPLPKEAIMALIVFVYLIGGCFMDALAMVLLTIPILFPLVTAMGFDPVWFGVIIVLVAEMGAMTPPVGINVYVLSGIAKEIPLETIFKGALPFVFCVMLCITLLIMFPQIALYLPSLIH